MPGARFKAILDIVWKLVMIGSPCSEGEFRGQERIERGPDLYWGMYYTNDGVNVRKLEYAINLDC